MKRRPGETDARNADCRVRQAAQAQQLRHACAQGGEVLVKILSAGVCHSDLHLWEGFFDLGMGQKLDISTRGMKLPFTLGHEIAGEVAAVGPDVKDVRVGQRFVVFPWIGCGTCAFCKDGDELLCPTPRTLGTRRDGGYADHVIVPHPRYLVDHGNTPIDLACTYACSGLTAYSAIRRAQKIKNMKKLLIVGAGGVGLAGLEVARAIHDGEIWVADIDETKLKIAREHGAHRTFNPEGSRDRRKDRSRWRSRRGHRLRRRAGLLQVRHPDRAARRQGSDGGPVRRRLASVDGVDAVAYADNRRIVCRQSRRACTS